MIAVLGATGAVGGRFVEVVAGEQRAAIRVILSRWRGTARIVRFPIELRRAELTGPRAVTDLRDALTGCRAVVSFIDGDHVDEGTAVTMVEAAAAADVERVVHLGCLRSWKRPPVDDGVADRRRKFDQSLIAAGERVALPVTVLAASLIYGPFTGAGAHDPFFQVERGRVAVAAGNDRCPLIYVDDVVEAVWAAVALTAPATGLIEISGPESVTWERFFEAFEPIVGRPAVAVLPKDQIRRLVRDIERGGAEPRWPDPPTGARRVVRAMARRMGWTARAGPVRRRLVLCDAVEVAHRATDVEVQTDEARDRLGWQPVVSFEEGMRRTGDYLRWAIPR